MMDNLFEAIKVVAEKLSKYRTLYLKNEMATRGHVIEPILRGLGWDTENPEQVQPDITTEEGVPDYSLIKDGRKVLFIEAKNLSIDIAQRDVIRQLARYCFGEGMKYGVLTNGAIWVLFLAFQEGTTMEERIVWKVDIEHDGKKDINRRLSTLSRANITNIEQLIKKMRILDEVWGIIQDEPSLLASGLIPVVNHIIKDEYSAYDFEKSEIEDFLSLRVKELFSQTEMTGAGDIPDISQPRKPRVTARPTKVKIGADSFVVRYSYDILVQTAEWLIRKGKLKRASCPIVAGPKRNLIDVQPKHKSGDLFRAPQELSNGLYIETHYSTASLVSYAEKLLEISGYRSEMLEVQ